MKSWRGSKTMLINMSLLAVQAHPKIRSYIRDNPEAAVQLTAMANIALRGTTKKGIAMPTLKDWVVLGFIAVFLAAVMLVGGCSSADITIPVDPSPAPLDSNYHNILMRSSCGPGLGFGQMGCSVSSTQDLTKEHIEILSPLGGAMTVYSKECHYDERIMLDKGQIVKLSLFELVPPKTKFCTFSVVMNWVKPQEINTEVPLRGQSGRIYIRVRPDDSAPAELEWTPKQGNIQKASGLIFAQFRGNAGGTREPVILKVRTTKPVGNGIYELWSQQEGIGIKQQTFQGQELEIPADRLLGNFPFRSYILDGFAVGNAAPSMLYLDNSFTVAISIFRYDVVKLAARITKSDAKEICFDSENTVALAAMSGIDKALNASKGCFPRPADGSVLALFTSVGRSAYYIVGGDGQWVQ